MSEKTNSKKKTGTAKKIVAGFMASVLLVGGTIVGTLAFLKTTSDTVKNTFTASSDIKLGLDEPNYNWDSTKNGPKDESKPNPGDYQPDTTYSKDPTLYNLTGSTKQSEEWVAMRVDYTIGGVAVTQTQLTQDSIVDGHSGKGGLINAITFDIGDSGSWIKLTTDQLVAFGVSDPTYEIYVYKYKLKEKDGVTAASDTNLEVATEGNGGGRTTKLFNEITVKSKTQLADNGYNTGDGGLLELPTFEITLKGAAAKHDDTVKDTTKIVEADLATNTTASYKIVNELVGLLK